MPTKPSKNDLRKIAQFLKLVQSRKPLSQSGYDTLMSCHTLPRYILNHIDTYYRHHQRGGAPGECCILWPADEREGCESCEIPDPNSPYIIGEGAYGQVFEDPKDNTVTKYFTFKQDNSKLFVDHLKARLPLVFDTIKDYGVYQELFTISSPEPEQIAYKMIKLQALPLNPIIKHDKLYNILLNMLVRKINELHRNKNIVHCDMKVDNVMFLGEISDYTNIKELFDTLDKNLKIIDFDGCMFKDTIAKEIGKGYMYHPTTPAFAHSFLIEHLYYPDTKAAANSTERIQRINSIRTICGRSFLKHDDYHEKIFPGHTYESLFPAIIKESDPVTLHKIMKFCDYYNMAMSMLNSKLVLNDSGDAVINSTCAVLKKIAGQLILQDGKGGGRKHKHRGGTPPALACPMTAKNILEKGQYLEIGIGEQMSIRGPNVTSSTPEADIDQSALEDLEDLERTYPLPDTF